MFIDTHTHLSYNFGVNPKEYIKNAKEVNVNYLILSCCDKDSINEGLMLIEEFDNIFLTIGYHPSEVLTTNDKDILELEKIINEHKDRIVGIGEIGLDYYYDKKNKDKQKELFIKQLELATKLNLPVVIHSRDSIQDTYDILSKYKLKGDIHCYSGSLEMAKLFIKLGYFIGIGGVITFKNNKLINIIEEIGIDNILLETDSPYLSPDRGKINESKNIPIIANKLSEILNLSVLEVANKTTNNALSLFDLSIKL